MEEIHSLAVQVRQLEEQLAHLRTTQAAQGAMHGPSGKTPDLKLPRPPETNGRQPTPISWAYRMELYLAAHHADFNHPDVVTFAAAYLKDAALSWWLQVEREAKAGRAPTLNTWELFKTAFVKRFTPISAEVERISQKTSVYEYASAFNNLMLELPRMDEADRIHKFIYGLKPEVRIHVKLKQPRTVAEAVELAIHADALIWGQRAPPQAPVYAP